MITSITTIAQLSHNLNMGSGYDGYRTLIESINFNPEEFAKLEIQEAPEHQRISIYDTPSVEAVISFWSPGQATPIHDYNFQQAWTKVLKGQLILEFFDVTEGSTESNITETQLIDEGEINYMNDGLGFHRFSNMGTTNAFAIHLFADKIESWKVFNEATGAITTTPVKYDQTL